MIVASAVTAASAATVDVEWYRAQVTIERNLNGHQCHILMELEGVHHFAQLMRRVGTTRINYTWINYCNSFVT